MRPTRLNRVGLSVSEDRDSGRRHHVQRSGRAGPQLEGQRRLLEEVSEAAERRCSASLARRWSAVTGVVEQIHHDGIRSQDGCWSNGMSDSVPTGVAFTTRSTSRVSSRSRPTTATVRPIPSAIDSRRRCPSRGARDHREVVEPRSTERERTGPGGPAGSVHQGRLPGGSNPASRLRKRSNPATSVLCPSSSSPRTMIVFTAWSTFASSER